MTKSISVAQVADTLKPYGVTLDPALADKIGAYIELLLKWNRTISLTTVTDPVEIVKFHFGESLFAASQLHFSQSRLADVGSGAGFPGVPLALTVPSLDVTLIESNSKKCAFLAEVVRELKLPNVHIVRDRMENVKPGQQLFDFGTARALGHHEDLLAWAKTKLSAGGSIVLWLGDEDSAEISGKSDWTWQPRALIPGSTGRFILAGSPIR
jgi:16S rRNA (guanine527-N7)-methyltransferase